MSIRRTGKWFRQVLYAFALKTKTLRLRSHIAG